MRRRAAGIMAAAALLVFTGCSVDDAAPGEVMTDAGTEAGVGHENDSGSPDAPDGGVSAQWCEVARALREEGCTDCHGAQPNQGAPMSLITWDDLHADSPRDASAKVYERVAARIADDEDPMPPPPNNRASDASIELLQTWAAASAPSGDDPTCDGLIESGEGSTDKGFTSSPSATALDPTDEHPEDCENMYRFLAHGEAGEDDTSKFNVTQATSDNLYQCFYFDVPWLGEGAAQAVEVTPLIDDSRVLHHWILYATDDRDTYAQNNIDATDTFEAGTMGPCDGTAGDRYMISGWAPGGEPESPPEDVGLALPSHENAGLILEVHYYNGPEYQDARDRSGAEVCMTHTPREHTAAVHQLGTEAGVQIPPNDSSTATGTCTPEHEEPIHILATSPHMHLLGARQEVIIHRQDGADELLLDEPFSFDQQVNYRTPAVIMPGDSLEVTCHFKNTTDQQVAWGLNTQDEMCYSYITAYPAGALSSASSLTTLANRCVD